MNRLSPYNVDHPLIRASLYREALSVSAESVSYEVSIDEVQRPDLISHRLDNTANTKLFTAVAGGLKSLRGEFSPAQVLSLKRSNELRRLVRKYQDTESVLEELNNGF